MVAVTDLHNFLAETLSRRGFVFSMFFSVCLEASLSQRLDVSYVNMLRPYVFLCDLMWFNFRANAQSPQGWSILCLF